MSVSEVDSSPLHLLPFFRTLVEAVIEEANRECAGKYSAFSHWQVFEGFRSQARQTYLYDQGRTTPGNIVTNAKVSLHHNTCTAADLVWCDAQGGVHWDGKPALWSVLGHCARMHGLEWGGDWTGSAGRLGDVGHIQIPMTQLPAFSAKVLAFKAAEGLV